MASSAEEYHLGDALYRKWTMYETSIAYLPEAPFEDYKICGSSYGGPVALVSKDCMSSTITDKLVYQEQSDNNDDKTKDEVDTRISLYTASGKLLSAFTTKEHTVINAGWSDQEQLVIVQTNGFVNIYDINGIMVNSFQLVYPNAEGIIPLLLECHFWGNGVVVLTSDLLLCVAEGLAVLKPSTSSSTSPSDPSTSTSSSNNNGVKNSAMKLYTIKTGLPNTHSYTCMAIVPPSLSRSALLEVMLGTSENSIIVIDENEAEDQLIQDRISAPIQRLEMDASGSFIACYSR